MCIIAHYILHILYVNKICFKAIYTYMLVYSENTSRKIYKLVTLVSQGRKTRGQCGREIFAFMPFYIPFEFLKPCAYVSFLNAAIDIYVYIDINMYIYFFFQ